MLPDALPDEVGAADFGDRGGNEQRNRTSKHAYSLSRFAMTGAIVNVACGSLVD
jgi:hypothetical protein